MYRHIRPKLLFDISSTTSSTAFTSCLKKFVVSPHRNVPQMELIAHGKANRSYHSRKKATNTWPSCFPFLTRLETNNSLYIAWCSWV